MAVTSVLDPSALTGIHDGRFAWSAEDGRAYLMTTGGAIPALGERLLTTLDDGQLRYMGADWFRGYRDGTNRGFVEPPGDPATVGGSAIDGRIRGIYPASAQRAMVAGGAGFLPLVEPPDWDFTASATLPDAITASGGANATRIDSTGAIVAATAPRDDHDPVTLASRGVWIEEARTNVFLNALLDGTSLTTQAVTVSAQAYTISFYGAGSITLSGAHSHVIASAGDAPTRTTYTFTPSAGTLTCTVSGEVKWAQCEAGAFATSFIPTAGATVTRSADTLTIADISAWWNGSEGTILFDGDILAAGTRVLWQVDDGSLNNRHIAYVAGSNAFVRSTAAGVSQGDLAPGAVTANTPFALGFGFAANDSAACLDGGAVATDSTVTLPTGLTTLRLGSDGGTRLNGHIRRFRYIPRRVSDAELQALTA